MKIKCIKLTYTLTEHRAPVNHYPFLENYQDILALSQVYIVYGFSVWHNMLHYLLNIPYGDRYIRPDWYPADLFEVVDSLLPNNMYFRYFGLDDKRGVNALCGYKELIYDYGHYHDLIEYEMKALQIFQYRMQEIETNS